MSTNYIIYTEAKIGDEWHCIDPLTLRVGAKEEDNKYRLSRTYENGSRSYFGEAAEKLENMSVRFSFEALSDEFRKICESWMIEPEELPKYVERCCYVIPLDAIRDAVTAFKGKTNHGLIHKDCIAEYEAGDTAEIYDQISPQEFSELDDEAKKVYQYYEWDDPAHWLPYLRTILNRATYRLSMFENDNYLLDPPEARLILEIS